MLNLKDLKFNQEGLIPVIVQDAEKGDILMMAYMNREALERTVETGLAHFYSRSRGGLWQKGEESGHLQRIREIRYDCDGDALLLLVEQEVAACHTGHRSCFFRRLDMDSGKAEEVAGLVFDPAEVYVPRELGILHRVYRVIQDRRAHPKEDSYVSSLLDRGLDQVLKKIGEESAEAILSAKGGSREALIHEIADLWFHTLILLACHDILPEEVCRELERRHRERSSSRIKSLTKVKKQG
ncbi:MAG: bifunctional phosphoribosyl-AMP cyclohydrolase/phosphoribosyl-ATP diphosphatase HisIE [candidate division NC10 bacterium]|nr:bifunctional phosphoribosyl-AMP cyclohydrolase/phosphoribosyl-ATP diphosphatase HisIE [candidate division NC10 bacterium]